MRLVRSACLLAALLSTAAARAQTMEEMSVARDFIRALADPDPASAKGMIDFETRAAERLARGLDPHHWAELDEEARQLAISFAFDEWVGSFHNYIRSARLISVEGVTDPDKGFGPVPDRHILRIVMHRPSSDEYRDALLTLTPGLRIVDYEQGDPYRPGENPAGPSGLLPRPQLVTSPFGVRWPGNVDAGQRNEVTDLVDALLAAPEGPAVDMARLALHRVGRASVAALVERLILLDRQTVADEPAGARLLAALAQITGRETAAPAPAADGAAGAAGPGGPLHGAATDWLAWHNDNGWAFVPAPLPTVAPVVEPPPVPAPEVAPAPDVQPAAPPTPPVGPALSDTGAVLLPAAADLTLRYAGRRVTGREIESELAPCMRVALNDWAATAAKLEMSVISTGRPEHLLLGRASEKQLDEIAQWLDQAAALLDPLVPAVPPRRPRTVVVFVFDEQGQRSKAWGSLLNDLSVRKLVYEDRLNDLREVPNSLTRRQTPFFIQLTWDLAGEGEFRLGNEIVGKFAQCLVTSRAGEMPPGVLWGMNDLTEMRLFNCVYQFDMAEFMPTADHFDWFVRTKQMLESRQREKNFSLAEMAADDGAAGKPQAPQMITWATLAWLAEHRPADLVDLLTDLAGIQDAADPMHREATWRARHADTVAILNRTMESVELKRLVKWLDDH